MDDGVDDDVDDDDDADDDNENDYDDDHSKDDDEQEILFPYHPKGLIVVDLQSAIIDDGMMITKIIVFLGNYDEDDNFCCFNIIGHIKIFCFARCKENVPEIVLF